MMGGARVSYLRVPLTAFALFITSCYAHYSWLSVDAGDRAALALGSGDQVAFSDQDKRAAVRVASSVAERLGLQLSWMEGLRPARMTPENPFQELALYQGTGRNSNLLLTVAVKDDGSVLRFWISDLDHSQRTELVGQIVQALKDELARAFPDRGITIGEGHKLRIYERGRCCLLAFSVNGDVLTLLPS
jgi:hypothetical protein